MIVQFFRRLCASRSRLLIAPVTILQKDGEKLSRNEIGELGEQTACSYLRMHDCKVLYRNYSSPKGGEVDIVLRDGDELVFTEVKTRTRRGFGRPLDAVDSDKQQLIERGANSWLSLLGKRDMLWRFDVVEIILSEGELADVTWVKDAF